MEYRKTEDNKLEVTEPKVATHNLETLKYKRGVLIARGQSFAADNAAAIAKIDALIAKCDELGIVSPEEEIVENGKD